jgi:hypothetical protein
VQLEIGFGKQHRFGCLGSLMKTGNAAASLLSTPSTLTP